MTDEQLDAYLKKITPSGRMGHNYEWVWNKQRVFEAMRLAVTQMKILEASERSSVADHEQLKEDCDRCGCHDKITYKLCKPCSEDLDAAI